MEGEKYQWHNYPVNQLFGVQNEFPSFMANTHRLLATLDCEYYLQRLDALQEVRSIARKPEGARAEADPPARFVVEKVFKEMNDFVAQPAAENILSTSFKERAKKIRELTDVQRADFQTRVEDAVTTGLSRLPKADRLFQRPPPEDDDRRWGLEIARRRRLLRLRASTEHDHDDAAARGS